MVSEETSARAATPKKRLPLTPIVVLGVAVAEAAAFFVVYQYLGGGPAAAQAAGSPMSATAPAVDGPEGTGHGAAPSGTAEKPASAHGTPSHEGAADDARSKHASGAEGQGAGAEVLPAGGCAEVLVLKNFKVPNNKSGRMFIYDLDISVVVAGSERERVEKLVKDRGAEIADNVALLIRRASERTLGEDDLRTLRSQLKEVIVAVVGSDRVILRVLIPRFVPIRAD